MKKILDFVKGAVSTKDLIPVLTNFHFYSGRVQGGNGRITIDAPLDAPLDLGGVDITVPAVPFLRAVDACGGAPVLNITEGGRLTMKKGKFRSVLPLSDSTSFPLQTLEWEGHRDWKPGSGLIKILRTIRPFIGEDASRPWACGVLFSDGYLYATNNVVMVRIPYTMPEGTQMNLPSYAVDELLRIGEDPERMLFDENKAAFHYGDRWMRSNLFDVAWPDVSKFFDEAALDPVPEGLREAVEKIRPFCQDSKFPIITMNSEGVHTAEGDMGASVEGYELPDSKYRAEPLQLVLTHAKRIDLSKYPGPVPFVGDNGLEGVMIGVKS